MKKGKKIQNKKAVDEHITKIPIEKIKPLFKRNYSQEDKDSLKASLNELGQLQNIVVRKDGDSYLCLFGWGRVLLLKELGKTYVDAKIIEGVNDLMVFLSENICRMDLEPFEKEMWFFEYKKQTGLSNEKIGAQFGRSKEWIRRLVTAYEIRSPLGEKASHLPTDIVCELRDISNDDREKVVALIKVGEIEKGVNDVRKFVNSLKDADDNLKEMMLDGSDTTPKIETLSTTLESYSKIFNKIQQIDVEQIKEMDEIHSQQTKRKIRYTSCLLAHFLLKLDEIPEQDYKKILDILGISPKSFERLIE